MAAEREAGTEETRRGKSAPDPLFFSIATIRVGKLTCDRRGAVAAKASCCSARRSSEKAA